MRKNSVKNVRINAEVQRVIAEAIRFSKDPRISPMTSVMEVMVAPDLKTCKVWVSVLGDEEERARTMEGLKSASGYIRSTLAREINLRNTPQLTFLADESTAYAIEMTRKIEEVAKKDAEAQALRAEREGITDEDIEDTEEESEDE